MTRIHVLSDLHLEVNRTLNLNEAPPECDLIMLPGDIINQSSENAHHYQNNVEQLTDYLDRSDAPKVAVIGNHELYRSSRQRAINHARKFWAERGVKFVESEGLISLVEGVTLHCCTLWTNFEDSNSAMAIASNSLNDFRLIKSDYDETQRITPLDQRRWNIDARMWLENSLHRAPKGNKNVVMTHYSPSLELAHGRYAGSPLNPAFHNSGMEHLIERADLWLFGHTHDAIDQVIHGCRCVANPHGYQPGEADNGFDPGLVVKI